MGLSGIEGNSVNWSKICESQVLEQTVTCPPWQSTSQEVPLTGPSLRWTLGAGEVAVHAPSALSPADFSRINQIPWNLHLPKKLVGCQYTRA